jgi:hypothetical protein
VETAGSLTKAALGSEGAGGAVVDTSGHGSRWSATTPDRHEIAAIAGHATPLEGWAGRGLALR